MHNPCSLGIDLRDEKPEASFDRHVIRNISTGMDGVSIEKQFIHTFEEAAKFIA